MVRTGCISESALCVTGVVLQLVDSSKVSSYQPGQELDVASMFKEGDKVDIAGTTIGKGFQGM